jgi:hypothetical protein
MLPVIGLSLASAQIGPAGPRADTGKDAPAIASWETDDPAFVAYPLLSDGRRGAGLRLRGMFQEFNDQINAEDDAEQIEAARASREGRPV